MCAAISDFRKKSKHSSQPTGESSNIQSQPCSAQVLLILASVVPSWLTELARELEEQEQSAVHSQRRKVFILFLSSTTLLRYTLEHRFNHLQQLGDSREHNLIIYQGRMEDGMMGSLITTSLHIYTSTHIARKVAAGLQKAGRSKAESRKSQPGHESRGRDSETRAIAKNNSNTDKQSGRNKSPQKNKWTDNNTSPTLTLPNQCWKHIYGSVLTILELLATSYSSRGDQKLLQSSTFNLQYPIFKELQTSNPLLRTLPKAKESVTGNLLELGIRRPTTPSQSQIRAVFRRSFG